jgi:hypothetical protein
MTSSAQSFLATPEIQKSQENAATFICKVCCSLEEENRASREKMATMKATMETMEISLQSDSTSAALAVPLDKSRAAASVRLKTFQATILKWFQDSRGGKIPCNDLFPIMANVIMRNGDKIRV